ncbi:MAG TPA: 50S ribosomal protein L29 [Candidatus Limnocylindrales bacterium]|nr:50S ribosomal protein L29 [Candidatus Limnocylindrales bacterium]
MDAEKLRNLTDAELLHQERELNDQLFRMKFQLKMGQTESLNKIRGLRKDVARVKTIMREKELGLENGARSAARAAAAAEEAAPEAAAVKKTAKTAAKAKPAAKKKSAGAKAKARKK